MPRKNSAKRLSPQSKCVRENSPRKQALKKRNSQIIFYQATSDAAMGHGPGPDLATIGPSVTQPASTIHQDTTFIPSLREHQQESSAAAHMSLFAKFFYIVFGAITIGSAILVATYHSMRLWWLKRKLQQWLNEKEITNKPFDKKHPLQWFKWRYKKQFKKSTLTAESLRAQHIFHEPVALKKHLANEPSLITYFFNELLSDDERDTLQAKLSGQSTIVGQLNIKKFLLELAQGNSNMLRTIKQGIGLNFKRDVLEKVSAQELVTLVSGDIEILRYLLKDQETIDYSKTKGIYREQIASLTTEEFRKLSNNSNRIHKLLWVTAHAYEKVPGAVFSMTNTKLKDTLPKVIKRPWYWMSEMDITWDARLFSGSSFLTVGMLIGTLVAPGIGTVLGLLIGGVIGITAALLYPSLSKKQHEILTRYNLHGEEMSDYTLDDEVKQQANYPYYASLFGGIVAGAIIGSVMFSLVPIVGIVVGALIGCCLGAGVAYLGDNINLFSQRGAAADLPNQGLPIRKHSRQSMLDRKASVRLFTGTVFGMCLGLAIGSLFGPLGLMIGPAVGTLLGAAVTLLSPAYFRISDSLRKRFRKKPAAVNNNTPAQVVKHFQQFDFFDVPWYLRTMAGAGLGLGVATAIIALAPAFVLAPVLMASLTIVVTLLAFSSPFIKPVYQRLTEKNKKVTSSYAKLTRSNTIFNPYRHNEKAQEKANRKNKQPAAHHWYMLGFAGSFAGSVVGTLVGVALSIFLGPAVLSIAWAVGTIVFATAGALYPLFLKTKHVIKEKRIKKQAASNVARVSAGKRDPSNNQLIEMKKQAVKQPVPTSILKTTPKDPLTKDTPPLNKSVSFSEFHVNEMII